MSFCRNEISGHSCMHSKLTTASAAVLTSRTVTDWWQRATAITTLSVCTYAAVWVQGGGTAWHAIPGFTAGQYQAKFNQMSECRSFSRSQEQEATRCLQELSSNGRSPGGELRFGLTDGPDTDLNSFSGVSKWALNNNFIL